MTTLTISRLLRRLGPRTRLAPSNVIPLNESTKLPCHSNVVSACDGEPSVKGEACTRLHRFQAKLRVGTGSQAPSGTLDRTISIPIIVEGAPRQPRHPKTTAKDETFLITSTHTKYALINLPKAREKKITIASSLTKYLYVSRDKHKRLLRRRKWKNRNVVRKKR